MNSVDYDIGAKSVISQHFADNPRIAMIKRPHGVEGVSGMMGACLHPSLRAGQIGVRMSHAHADISSRRFGDHFQRAGKFRGDRHHANVSARSLPETLKNLQCGLRKILWRMHAAALMAEKRSFQMDAESLSMRLFVICSG